jgi:hypothetical protein
LAILELLSRTERAPSLTQIGTELGTAKSNVRRLMQALVETGSVAREEDAGTSMQASPPAPLRRRILWDNPSAVEAHYRETSQ